MRKPLAPLRWLATYPEWAAIELMAGMLAGLLTAIAWRA